LTGPEPVTPATRLAPDNLTAFSAPPTGTSTCTPSSHRYRSAEGHALLCRVRPRRDHPADQRSPASRPAAPSQALRL